jgi:hypothetical protein
MSLVTVGNDVCGLKITLFGMPLVLMILNGESGGVPLSSNFGIWRPTYLIFFKERHVYSMTLLWEQPGPQTDVFISHGDKNVPIPRGTIL